MEDIEKLVTTLRTNDLWPTVIIDGREVDTNRAAADALERLKNSNEVLRAERDELHKNNCGLRGENTGLRAELAASQRREQAAVEDSVFRCCKTCRKNGRGYNGSCKYCEHCEFIPDGFPRGTRDLWEWRGPGAGKGTAE